MIMSGGKVGSGVAVLNNAKPHKSQIVN